MPLVLPKPTHRLIHDLLAAVETAHGIRVYAKGEPPPLTTADTGDDDPVERWCRVANVVPTRIGGRPGTNDRDFRGVAITITVGVSDEVHAADPTRIETDAGLVALGLHGKTITADGHTLVVHDANAEDLPAGATHESIRLMAVVATGTIQAA